MDKKLNPLDGEIDLLGDTVSDIIRKLNPLTGRLELVYKADSYIQKINPFIGDFDMVGGTGASYIIKEVTGNGYINLTNAVANHLMELKAYGGTEQRNLPSGYTQYEYLRSNGTQYIDLGYKGNGNTKVEIKFKYHTATSASGSGRVFGSRTSSSSNAFAIGTSSGVVSSTSNKVFWCYDGQSFYVVDDVVFGLDEWETVIFSATEHKVDGTTYGDDYNITTFETPSNLMLFAFDNNGTVGVGYVDIAYCKLWDNGVLIRDLIPCKNSSNVFGMYDRVSETLLTNAGTGTFETGNAATPTPDEPMNIVCNNGIIRYTRNMANVNEQTALVGYYISSSGVLTADSNNRIYQDYIPVLPETTYTLSFDYSVYYVTISEYSTADDSGFVIRNAGSSGSNTSLTITTSATTNYVRFGTNIDRAEVTIERVLAINRQLEKGSEITPYRPYSPTGYCVDGATETIWAHGKNLFDSTPYKTGYYIDASGNEVDATQYQEEYLIRQAIVQPSTTYTISVVGTISGYTQRIHAYDKDGNWISQITTLGPAVGDTSKYTFTSPANCKYIRQGGRNQTDYQLEQGSTATDYEPYVGGTATTEMLLKVGDYVDEQEILSGDITRKIGIKVLDGTENWFDVTGYTGIYGLAVANGVLPSNTACVCSHYLGTTASNATMENDTIKAVHASLLAPNKISIYIKDTNVGSLANFKTFLATQYQNGQPIICAYPLVTATTETVTGQTLNIQNGNNTIEITQASIDNLGLYAKYKATA